MICWPLFHDLFNFFAFVNLWKAIKLAACCAKLTDVLIFFFSQDIWHVFVSIFFYDFHESFIRILVVGFGTGRMIQQMFFFVIMTTVPPLAACLITISLLWRSSFKAFLSDLLKLSLNFYSLIFIVSISLAISSSSGTRPLCSVNSDFGLTVSSD